MSKILFDEQPIVVDKMLARKLGLNEAIVIQQVHYWLKINEKKNQNYIDGKYWTFNTLKEWHENNFDFWSLDTVKRTFTKLENTGVLIVGNFNKDRRDRTKWYSINYKKLEELVSEKDDQEPDNCKSANCTNAIEDTGHQRKSANCTNAIDGSGINCKSAICPNAKAQFAPMHMGKMHQALPETTNRDYYTEIYPSNHPSIYIDSLTYKAKTVPNNGMTPMDGGTDGPSANTKNSVQPTEQPGANNYQAKLIIRQIMKNTGATSEQVQRAISRANFMEKEGKVRGNYLKLVEAITDTIVKEDLLKQNGQNELNSGEKEKIGDGKKKLIQTLYMS
ncbi:hypothetical protein [Desulfoscipio geothermicus]|uniref:Uncharacterized protein n=1 Tax=Desulfoscipio geothermicus DSM 3669 TaxID=1121426 RepID=A0A1I6E443_9FIRM|nr:hypothetical protein [Desulfoscipio geothermicus]SFR12544.1 hypothetical protein SAMN05660706_12549 [Desulfoscipio geothermicus DSM 3669]